MTRPSYASTTHLRRSWYTLSVDTLRGFVFFIALVALAGIAFLGYRRLEEHNLRGAAATRIEEAQQLATRVQQTSGAGRFRAEWETGWHYLQTARRELEREDFRAAARDGALARNVLLSILDSLDRRGAPGDASFVSVHGGVEYRRGGAGLWEPARQQVTLRAGDYVRTSGRGSAEVMFADGTLYNVRPNTSFIVSDSENGGGERAIAMEYGWVNLDTTEREARVTTPSAEARVGRDSQAYVAYDADRDRARFGAFRGTIQVSSDDGTVDVEELEEAQQVRGRLSAARTLPGRVQLVEPTENSEADAAEDDRLVLSWRPVTGAARYALQVSRNHLFVDNVIDVEDRTSTRATLGLLGEGSFQWRVAAVGSRGSLGPWSTPRKFRVSSSTGSEDGEDDIPPALAVEEITAYGSIFIVRGSAEPGSTLRIEGEPVNVDADGSFYKTLQLRQEGWANIEVEARDAWGNESTKKQRVYVDIP